MSVYDDALHSSDRVDETVMDTSLQHRLSAACPVCGATFTIKAWLIVDVASRPRLLARVRRGTLHIVACPHGHRFDLDAPLLLFYPNTTSPFMYSPAQHSSPEQDEEQLAELLILLRERLGSHWRVAWDTESVPM